MKTAKNQNMFAHNPNSRWVVGVNYRHDDGVRLTTFELEELSDLADKIEAGPHWDTIVGISIKRAFVDQELTVEQAQKL